MVVLLIFFKGKHKDQNKHENPVKLNKLLHLSDKWSDQNYMYLCDVTHVYIHMSIKLQENVNSYCKLHKQKSQKSLKKVTFTCRTTPTPGQTAGQSSSLTGDPESPVTSRARAVWSCMAPGFSTGPGTTPGVTSLNPTSARWPQVRSTRAADFCSRISSLFALYHGRYSGYNGIKITRFDNTSVKKSTERHLLWYLKLGKTSLCSA